MDTSVVEALALMKSSQLVGTQAVADVRSFACLLSIVFGLTLTTVYFGIRFAVNKRSSLNSPLLSNV